MSYDVTLITATGERPESFARCYEYVMGQDFDDKEHTHIQWIVVDDGAMPTRIPLWRWSWFDLEVVRPEPFWQPGQNTLARNLPAAIPLVRADKILFIEDDDWYSADYLRTMSIALDTAAIVGCIPARYYNVPSQLYRILPNRAHASLCETAIRGVLLQRLQEICSEPSKQFIDVRLWESVTPSARRYLHEANLCVGIKGMPGRRGIGIGHRPEAGGDWHVDPDGSVLRAWIGKDAERYF